MTPDDGFYYTRRSVSTAEAVAQNPRGREVNVAKAAIQRYIQLWLTPDTARRILLERYSPRAATFVLNRPAQRNIHVETGFSWETGDPTQRRVQVARMMKTLPERQPAILLVDGGFRNRPAGLGDLQGGRRLGKLLADYDLTLSLTINIDIIIGANDEGTCGDLALLVSEILGSPLRRLGGGNHLVCSEGDSTYQITLPLENSFGALTKEAVPDDPIDQKWTTSTSIEIAMESNSSLRGGVISPITMATAVNASESILPSISGSGRLQMGRIGEYSLFDPAGNPTTLPGDWKVIVSDHRVATLVKSGRCICLRGIRPGNVEIQVVSTRQREVAGSGHSHPEVLARREVTIHP